MMQIFDDDLFRAFLGKPWLTQSHEWGSEWRFAVSRENLENFKDILRDTLYHHHSYFSLQDEIGKLGFSLSAQALKKLYSGNPANHNTQMGNLGEVLGAHFARTYLDYQAKPIYPKRFNPNVDQSMKGVDVLSFKDSNAQAEILFGEVKTGINFDRRVIEDAYEALVT